ncbi:glycosyltransferase [Sphingomonas aerophila]|uniref:Glycosyltransferase involved in cell wall biosynthesis n=1 Tax=Sphingomonas aerophila TaxID=1344948 RepID=A0A7W9EW34_9SPHN|nr:glycosyltransferase [Sphingomonas aerophila]MBB5716870.1 glycosyltransferase involved in cell wall biosynthesis [Sphingomonas aerophila]
MKVLFLAPQPFFVERGTPIAVRFAVETLCQAGHEVDLVVLHGGEDIAMPGLTLHRVKRPPFVGEVPIGLSPAKILCDLFLVATAFRLLSRKRFDVIHAVEESVFPALAARAFRRFKLVYDMDSLMGDQVVEKWPRLAPLRRLFAAIERWPMRRADLVMPVCAAIADRVRALAPGQTIQLLPDVATPVAAASPNAGPVLDLRTVVGSATTSIALYVGNLESYQGTDLLIDAFAQLPPGCDCHLIIVGGRPDHVEAARARARAVRAGERVSLIGPAPLAHLPALLRQADILCSPRLKGVNTPMKIYAYMQAGRGIVATDILSHTQVLDQSRALLVPPGAAAFAGAVAALAADRALRERLGVAAARYAEEEYGADAFQRRLLAGYATLLDEHSALPRLSMVTASARADQLG